jgi:hypothetical protein
MPAARLAAMNPTSYDDAQLLPLTTDAEIEARVADLIGRANSRQLWLLFLDEVEVQLPVLIPIDSLPSVPTHDEGERVATSIRDLMGQIGASAVITVLERYASSALTAGDLAWAQTLRECCDRQGVRLRAQLLSHRSGVRRIADDELVA